MDQARTMHALRAHTRGGPDQLIWEIAPRPEPRAAEVLLAVDATAITFAELSWDLTWETADGTDRTPTIPGHEVVGRVVAAAPDVQGVELGETVYGLVPFDRNGGAAEFVALPASAVAAAPRNLDAVEAAALPLAALTAWQALVDHARIEPGEHVLVQGGAGGVGVYAVQIAVIHDAVVTATCSSEDIGFVRSIGAAEVFDRDEDPTDARLADFDIVIDTVGGEVLKRSYPMLRLGGRLVTLSGPPPPGWARQYGVEAEFFIVEPNQAQLSHLAELADTGTLRPVVAQCFLISEGRAAYESFGEPRGPGKTVLRAGPDQPNTRSVGPSPGGPVNAR